MGRITAMMRAAKTTFATPEAQKSKVADFCHTNLRRSRGMLRFRESKVADFCNT
jgi:hypothetical protein